MTINGFHCAMHLADKLDYSVDVYAKDGLMLHLSPDEVHDYYKNVESCKREISKCNRELGDGTIVLPKGDNYMFVDHSVIVSVYVNTDCI